MDAKTPVTLLHEYLMKLGEIPEYKLVYNGVGTHDPLFQYEVIARGIIASGKGKSKKEAKHDAARSLLLQLQDDRLSEAEVNVVSPYAHSLKSNAVGLLQDFCLQHNATSPRYELIRDEGLAHAKIFGMRCTVSSFTTEAEARTKKQAKQQASNLMLEKLQKCIGEESFCLSSNPLINEDEIAANASSATKKAYEKILLERSANEKDKISGCRLGTSLINFAEHFLENVLPLSECLQSIANCDDLFFETHKNPEELLDTIMNQLDYKYSYGDIQSISKTFLAYVQIKDLNSVLFIGLGDSETAAKKKSTVKALQFLATMSRP